MALEPPACAGSGEPGRKHRRRARNPVKDRDGTAQTQETIFFKSDIILLSKNKYYCKIGGNRISVILIFRHRYTNSVLKMIFAKENSENQFLKLQISRSYQKSLPRVSDPAERTPIQAQPGAAQREAVHAEGTTERSRENESNFARIRCNDFGFSISISRKVSVLVSKTMSSDKSFIKIFPFRESLAILPAELPFSKSILSRMYCTGRQGHDTPAPSDPMPEAPPS